MLVLEHGKPMIFGKDRDKGIRLNGLHPEIVTLGENGVTEADLLVHDETAPGPVSRVHAVAHVVAGLPGAGRRAAPHRAADARPAGGRPDRRRDHPPGRGRSRTS